MATCYQVAGGGEHTLIALDTGDVYSCGKGIDGQLGNATEEQVRETNLVPSNVTIPTPIDGFNEVIIHLAAGQKHSAALSAGGTLFMWGDISNTFRRCCKAKKCNDANLETRWE